MKTKTSEEEMIKNTKANFKKKWWTCRYDRPFKDVFCGEDNKPMLEPLLSTMMEEQVEVEEIFTNELANTNILDRRKTVDLFAKVNGKYTLVELNNVVKDYVPFRNFVFFTSMLAQKTKMGENYDKNIEYILINLNYGKKNEEYIVREYKLQTNDNHPYLENIRVLDFNMDRIKDIWYHGDRKKVQKYKYLIMLDLSKEELDDFTKGGDLFMEEFNKRVTKLNSDNLFQAWMSAEEENTMIYNTDMKIAREEGIKEGHTSGLKEGKVDIINKMISKGKTIEEISDLLDITVDEIHSLIKN